MSNLFNTLQIARAVLLESAQVYFTLLKVMVPALIVVKLLQELGAIDFLGDLLAPAMTLVGLPSALGIVWATTLLANLFTGVVVFFQIAQGIELTVEQVTVLGTLMLIGHSIPVEGAVAKRAGVPWWVTVVLRVGGAMLLGWILHVSYAAFDLYQMPVEHVFQLAPLDNSIASWVVAQLRTLFLIFFIILALIILLRVVAALGIEQVLHIGLAPLLRLLGIGKAAANTTVVGVALGLSYGAGLLIREVEQGTMTRKDSFLSLCFLGLLHGVIEDTLVIMAIGADLSGILWARIIFSIAIAAILAQLVKLADF